MRMTKRGPRPLEDRIEKFSRAVLVLLLLLALAQASGLAR